MQIMLLAATAVFSLPTVGRNLIQYIRTSYYSVVVQTGIHIPDVEENLHYIFLWCGKSLAASLKTV